MGKPKKQTTPRRTGNRRSHHVLKLARKVNATSPVKVHTTRKETGVRVTAATKAANTAIADTKSSTKKTVKKTTSAK